MNEFHMVLGEKLHNRIAAVAQNQGWTFSGLCRQLLSMGISRFEQKFYRRGNRNSKWKKLGGVRMRHVIFIDDETYNRLMRLHNDCNFYSLGQIIRKIIGAVLAVVDLKGFGFARWLLDTGFIAEKADRYFIGSGVLTKHMHSQKRIKTIYSQKSVPIAVEYT